MFNNEMLLIRGKKKAQYTHKLTVGTNTLYYGYARNAFGILEPNYYELKDSYIVNLEDFYEDRRYSGFPALVINPVADQEGLEDDYQLYIIFNKDGNNYGSLIQMSYDHTCIAKLDFLLYLEEGKTYDVYISQTPPPFAWEDIADDGNHSGGDIG